ncbi:MULTISPECIES: helix-turn-helix domain-containing protein [unclassified Nocardia]|uniref:winged helix-turn-helix transcriptional regulator n=1 Tax=unclassified Nocardia TaxID=2637762 RepID=UPI001CE484AE|nr:MULTISPECIES: helix-turn-helix domain-containing protein [unclassified Nocardia]
MEVRSQVSRAPVSEPGDVTNIECSAREVVDVTSRWGGRILNALQDGPLRFSELQAAIDRISDKMLSQTLRIQIRDGLVLRTVEPATTPPQVSYELTELGYSLTESLRPFLAWVRLHAADVTAARQAYDLHNRWRTAACTGPYPGCMTSPAPRFVSGGVV